MILSLMCATALQSATAAEFFPTVPGTVRTYSGKGSNGLMINTVGKPLDAGGSSIIPITGSFGAGGGQATYYKVDQNIVSIYAYDPKHPLPVPMPLFEIGTGKVNWDFQGKTATGPNGERLLAHGEAHLAGQRNVLGKRVDVLIVDMRVALGIGVSGETIEQHVVYGRGIGMVEMTTKTRLGNNKKVDETTYTLSSVGTSE